MVNISFATLNCRGLNSPLKRALIYRKLENFDVSFLQETYVTDLKINSWKDQWTGNVCYSPGTNNSKGLMILYKRDFFDDKSETIFYKSERILGLKGLIEAH